MANQGGLQLLPETRKSITVTIPGENRMLYAGIAFLLFCALLVVGAYFLRQQKINKLEDLKGKIKIASDKIDSKIELVKSIMTISKQVGTVNKLLNDHVYWSNGFDIIETALSPQVQLENFSADTQKKEIRFAAYAPSYTVVAKQIASFVSEPLFTDVSVGKIVVETSGRLKFDMMLSIDAGNLLKYKE